ncbi:TIGR03915 family putative DNA repair protein [Fibrobacter sp. UBA2449]|uniref:TIGR03915 family putative DNA repair protein n=1 Tax=Fibrobacter sp. UBA2449 TaxID=1946529 RepID=UPI0025C586C4|nr:TIGR03915 family putative DNA repair protein [Fibrobacter sp. UBA2449]
MSLCISYDSSFDGFLSAVFEIYSQHLDVESFVPDRDTGATGDLFQQNFRVETNDESASRLRRAVVNYAGDDVLNLLYAAFLSEEPGVEMKILAYLRKLFAGDDPNFAKNVASTEMLPLYKLAYSVRHEAGGLLGMVRFSKAPGNFYVSKIDPKYDVLLLIEPHFRNRFSNENWVIYDERRKYALLHDRTGESRVVTLPDATALTDAIRSDSFTQLWQDYYKSIAIKERENPKLLRRCLPVRYWKNLTERQTACVPAL